MSDRKIRAVLFDMDGVLIDAKDWHYDALNEALALFGHKIHRFEHLEVYDGLPTRMKLRMLSREKDLPTGLHDFINEMKQQYTIDHAWRLCRPTFCHEYALARLKSDGYDIAVCSNSVRDSIEMMLTKAALIEHVDTIISNQDVANPKPDPEMYTKAAEGFGLAGHECLVIEDNPKGIEAAERAGCHVLVVDHVHEVQYSAIRERIESIDASPAGTPTSSSPSETSSGKQGSHEDPHPVGR